MEFRVRGGEVRVGCAGAPQLLAEVAARLGDGRGFRIATLNVDHLQKLDHDPAFRAAYAAHDLVVADGNPVVWLARLAGERLSLAPGSELVEPLCRAAAQAGVPVALVAGSQPAAEGAARSLAARNPGLRFNLLTAPGTPFDPASAEADALIAAIDASGARLCLLGFGAPRQERFAARAGEALPGVGFASVGAGLDFLAGLQTRAPAVVRRARLEWLWRAASSPRRLGPRYLRGFAILPGHALNALHHRLRSRTAARGQRPAG